jgi:hypothetical protein
MWWSRSTSGSLAAIGWRWPRWWEPAGPRPGRRVRRWRSTIAARSTALSPAVAWRGAVVEVAEKVLAGGEPQLVSYGIADDQAWDVGLPCGGEIDVWVERYEP